MLRIAVVDDRVEVCGAIEAILLSLSEQIGQPIETEPYTTSTAFLHALCDLHEVFDLIFLDIELDVQSGIDIANRIRYELQDEFQPIVYISGNPEYSLALHDTHPLGFLLKPLKRDEIERVLLRFLKLSGIWSDVFSYRAGGDTIKVKVQDICYFTVSNREIVMHLTTGIQYFSGSLREIGKQLEKHGFIEIHRSFLVNPRFVQIFEYDRVILFDGEILPIGSSKRSEICRKRMEWAKRGDHHGLL